MIIGGKEKIEGYQTSNTNKLKIHITKHNNINNRIDKLN